MKYKNCGRSAKTYFGITFNPGEVKEIKYSIKDEQFFRVYGDEPVKIEKSSKVVSQKRKYTKRQSKPIIKEMPEPLSEHTEDADKIKESVSEESE